MLKTTVIITAYNRKEFIKDAVNSVLENSQKPTEVIVVKNFKDEYVDSFLNEKGVINIYSDDETLGGKLAQGIYQSSGDIIFFLEDDDLFSKEKIRKVTQKFSRYELGFYHNSQQVFYDELPVTEPIQDFLYYHSVGSKRMVNYLFSKLKVGFNVSSMAISRDLADKCVKLLKNVKITADTFLFFCAVENNSPIMVDFEKLTYYRVLRGRNAVKSPNISLFRMQYEDALYFKSVFSSKALSDIIDRSVRQREMIYKLVSKEVNKKEALIYSLKLVSDLFRSPNKWNVFLLALSILAIISKESSRKIFLEKTYSNSVLSS